MLTEHQRQGNYANQRVATGGFCTISQAGWEPTPRQRRRIRHKWNKANGGRLDLGRFARITPSIDHLFATGPAFASAPGLVEAKERRANRDPQSGTAQEIARRKATRETVEYRHCPVESCLAYGDWESNPCITASGNKASKPHKGRYAG